MCHPKELAWAFGPPDEMKVRVILSEANGLRMTVFTGRAQHLRPTLSLDFLTLDSRLPYVPATVIPEINTVGEASALRNSRSEPTISTWCSISARFPAIVTSSTG